MHFDRFDICEAYYCFAMDYHEGQFSKKYKYIGRCHNLGFKPRPNLSWKTLSENGKWIYQKLYATRHCQDCGGHGQRGAYNGHGGQICSKCNGTGGRK